MGNMLSNVHDHSAPTYYFFGNKTIKKKITQQKILEILVSIFSTASEVKLRISCGHIRGVLDRFPLGLQPTIILVIY